MPPIVSCLRSSFHPICEKHSPLQLPGRICFPATAVIPTPSSFASHGFFVPSLFLRLLHLQTFDREKYSHLRADAPNNNNNNASNGKDKTLVGLRIDDKGGIYLQVNKPSSLTTTCPAFHL